MNTRKHLTTGEPLRPKVVVRKSRGRVFAGTWYVLAFGKCIRRATWEEAIQTAATLAPRHVEWAMEKEK